jgi:hypothetical protein
VIPGAPDSRFVAIEGPFMSLDLLSVIKASSDLVKGLKDFQSEPEKRDRLLQDDISRALRTLYFTPKGILSLLVEVADGKPLTEKRIQKTLIDFNDREWKVEEALQRIDFHALQRELGLSLSAMRVLEQLRYGKINLRRAVQAEVNPYGQDGTDPNKTKAKKLIAAIENLNADIEDVEAVINARARGGTIQPIAKQRTAAGRKATARKKAPDRKR